MMEDFEKLTINAIEGNEEKGEEVRAMVCPQALGLILINWISIEIHVVFSLS